MDFQRVYIYIYIHICKKVDEYQVLNATIIQDERLLQHHPLFNMTGLLGTWRHTFPEIYDLIAFIHVFLHTDAR